MVETPNSTLPSATAEGAPCTAAQVCLVSARPELTAQVAAALGPSQIAVVAVGPDDPSPTGPGAVDGGPGLLLVDLAHEPAAGLALVRRVRGSAPDRAVLALCAPGDAETAAAARRAGARDFCACDAPAWELRVRVAALLAAPGLPVTAGPELLVVGDLELDEPTRSVRRRGRRLALSCRQYELLRVLMRHAGEPLSQTRLLAEMGLPTPTRVSNLIEVHVHHLRRQIGAGRLSTLRGVGYVLHATPADGN